MAVAPAPGSLRRVPAGAWAVAVVVVLSLLVLAPRYGFHRDELYFIAAGRRLAWGYPDQPPLTPLIARLADGLPGDITPLAVRLIPALAVGTLALIAASLADRFGGSKGAAVLAAAATAGAGIFLAAGHLLATATIEALLACLVIAVVARLIEGASPRWWLLVGVLTGLGLLNKHTMAAIVGALVIGILVSPARRILLNPWPWVGGGIALVMWLPNLLWQASNGWPQLEMARVLSDRSDGPAAYLAFQFVGLSLLLAIPAVAGFRRLWRLDQGRWRAFPVAFVVLLVTFLVVGGKFYYVAPLYVPLLAAGAVWASELAARPRRLLIGASGAAILAFGLVALPVVPVTSVQPLNEVNGELGETVGWPELVAEVEAAVALLDPQQRTAAVIFTANYGQAGALEVLGGPSLPEVSSGHNGYGDWGPPSGTGPIIGVGPVSGELALVCPDVEQVGTVDNGYGVANMEQGAPILLCADPVAGLDTVWAEVLHLD